ncbi:hypothetical protein LXT21_31525 [Myxococcus sp. K38C18041901]|nr:hypothetical protein [Myxococcus guangdongensis]MCP3063319.1 hypothetical protein [Myxococcus guangdongensis]
MLKIIRNAVKPGTSLSVQADNLFPGSGSFLQPHHHQEVMKCGIQRIIGP